MKAAVLRETNKPLTIEDVLLDRPGPREVIVKTGAAGLCHSDLSVMNGTISIIDLPAVLGHESAGPSSTSAATSPTCSRATA